MAQADVKTRTRIPRLLRWLAGPLQGATGFLAGADLNVVAITAATVLLLGIGLLAIYVAEMANPDGDNRTLHQGTYVIATLAVMVLVSMIDYRRWGDWAYAHFGLWLVLLAMLIAAKKLNILNGLIPDIRNTRRWIDVGPVLLQPSEFAKIAYVIALAWYLRYRTNYRTLGGLVLPLAMTFVPMFLILLEPDLGTVLLMLPIFFAMLLVAGARRRHLLSLMLICVLGSPILYHVMHGYQRMRVLGPFLQSESIRAWILDRPGVLGALRVTRTQVAQWTSDQGYQLDRSLVALGTGGWSGAGDPDADCMRYDFLPDRHNDFIFSVIGHKWGWVGCLMVVACYGIILVGGCHISTATNEPFGRLLAAGLAMLMATQAVINIGMAIGLLPITGSTLPLVSYGGSSLVSTGILMGILLNIGLRRPILLAPEPFIFEKKKDAE